MDGIDWTVLSSVLAWIVAGGSVFIANYAFALIAENFEFWHKLPSWLKFLIPIITATLLAVGAQTLLLYPDIVEVIQPYWALIVTIIIAWLGSQRGLMAAKANSYGANYK
jgi:hypothetical protein